MHDWTVDYGEGPRPISLPHAWRQDVAVSWEGPAVYRTKISVQHFDEWLVFHGSSYESRVVINGKTTTHCGIWDEFASPLGIHAGTTVDVEVHVTKNGGAKYPVKDVLSGFLPYVFQSFGGLYCGVSVVRSASDPTRATKPKIKSRVKVKGRRIFVDGKPFYMRGVLSWGWYPELGHTNPSEDEIRKEVRLVKQMGFNTIKFCLWVPRHRFFEILEEEGMFAWLELPLWAPSREPKRQHAMATEIERIVRQYRHHRSIIAWTMGCELGAATTAEFRDQMVRKVQRLTGCPLVKDDSGGAEMYSGDLREFGTFDDFHPYCDTHFYPVVLDSLRQGARPERPILLGEFNDFDVHRDLVNLKEHTPFWASDDPILNNQGVRWQWDLPRVLRESRWATSPTDLAIYSIEKGAYVRRKVMEHVRACPDFSGFIVTGLRHTPISTSGMLDDDLRHAFPSESTARWNGPSSFFLVPYRRPPWVNGGNRPGWLDTQCFFAGDVFFKVGVHSETNIEGRLEWNLTPRPMEGRPPGRPDLRSGSNEIVSVAALRPSVVGEIAVKDLMAGEYVLQTKFAGHQDEWPVSINEKPDWKKFVGWSKQDYVGRFADVDLPGVENMLTTRLDSHLIENARSGAKVVAFLQDEGTISMPFWRECAFEFSSLLSEGEWLAVRFGEWHRLWSIAPDRALDPKWLKEKLGDYQVRMNRIDTRTYREHPYIAFAKVGRGQVIVTTLRPDGGHGAQPFGVSNNPSGSVLLSRLLTM